MEIYRELCLLLRESTSLLNARWIQYRSGDAWYDVHPPFWERVVQYGYSGSRG